MKRTIVLLAALAACTSGGDGSSSSGAASTTGATASDSTGVGSTGGSDTSGAAASTGSDVTGAPTSGDATSSPTTGATTTTTTGATTSGTTGGGAATAEQLLALTADCMAVSQGDYQSDDDGSPANIPICGLKGAVFWTADMDIDCDGKETPQCNLQTDPAYQNQTSAEDSQGQPLDAASLPYVVVPLPSNRFDYAAAGLELGTVIAVIYQGQVRYGVFGDEGPDNIIGEASYAMAQSLGVDPDPSTGGTDGPVTYIAFVGKSGVVGTIEDHDEAVSVGEARAAQLLAEN